MLQVLSKLSGLVYILTWNYYFVVVVFEHFRNEQILTIAKKYWNFYFMDNSLLWKLSMNIDGNLKSLLC